MSLRLRTARDSLGIARRLKDDGVYDDFQASHVADAVNHALNAIVLMLQEDALTDGDIGKLVRLIGKHTDIELPEYIVENSERISSWHDHDLFARHLIDEDDRNGMQLLMETLDDFIEDIDVMVHSM